MKRQLKRVAIAAMATAFTLGFSSLALSARFAPSASAGPEALQNSSSTVTVPAGTSLLVRMIDTVDSSKNKIGDRFTASLEADLVTNGTVVAPKGTTVYGRLANAQSAGHMTGKSELRLELTGIMINNQIQPILTSDYQVAGSSRGANTAKKVGGGAVAGTVVGAIVGGGKGAAIGAGVGAAAGGTAQILTHGQQVKIPSETLLEFRLQQPFTITPTNANH